MRSFFMPGKIKVYVLKIPLPSGTNKKGLCISAESSYISIILLVAPNYTYRVVPD